MFAIVIYSVKWCKLQGNLCKLFYDLIGIVRWLGIYCSTDYRLLYDDDGCCVVRWDVFHVVIAWQLCFRKPLIIRWWWMLCCAMRCFSCSYCVAIMVLKAFDYTMTIDVVSYDEMFFMLLLRVNYAFESLWLCDDNGYCVSSWRRGVQSTRYELCFWKPVVGEERAYLGWAITCGFQTRYGFCFFQLRSECEKTEPVPGSFHAFI